MLKRSMLYLCILIGMLTSTVEAQQISSTVWRIYQSTDVMTDENRALVHVAEAGTPGNRHLLAVGCRNGSPRLILGTGYMGGDRNANVQILVRFDEQPVSSVLAWPLMQGKTTVMAPASQTQQLIRGMIRGNYMRIRVIDPLDGEVKTMHFTLNGFSAAYNRLPCR